MYRTAMKRTVTTGAVILGLVVFATLPAATAQSNCKGVKGHVIQAFDPGTGQFSGPVTNAGDLTGSMSAMFSGAPFATNDPDAFSFTSDIRLATHLGDVKARQVNVYDNATGLTAGLLRVDPAASTGRFAGATGYLFLNGTTPSFSPFTVEMELSGVICYAR